MTRKNGLCYAAKWTSEKITLWSRMIVSVYPQWKRPFLALVWHQKFDSWYWSIVVNWVSNHVYSGKGRNLACLKQPDPASLLISKQLGKNFTTENWLGESPAQEDSYSSNWAYSIVFLPHGNMRHIWKIKPPIPVWASKKKYGCVWKCCVPLNPMVLLIIIPIKWLFHWEY